MGYRRYDTSDDLEALNVLYAVLRLYTNFFQPSTKLIEKTRIGSKVCKKYDRAKTPYRRVLESDTVPDEAKENLKQIYATLNPAKLNREMNWLQDRLDAVVPSKHKAEQNVNLEYIST